MIKRPTLLTLILAAVVLSGCATVAPFSIGEPYPVGGIQIDRYVWDTTAGRLARDGQVSAAAGYVWPIEGISKRLSLDVGPTVGSVIDSAIFTAPRATIGAHVGLDYDQFITLGIVPHYVTREPANRLASYGFGFQITTRLSNITDTIAGWFGDGVQDGIDEAFPK